MPTPKPKQREYKCTEIVVNSQARKKGEGVQIVVKLFKTRNEESVAKQKFWKAIAFKNVQKNTKMQGSQL